MQIHLCKLQPRLQFFVDSLPYNYYFQFTLTAYDNDIEENVPSKGKYIISTFKKLSDIIGKERVIWRYDPILLNDKYNVSYHFKNFEKLAKILSDYTEKCKKNVDFYKIK